MQTDADEDAVEFIKIEYAKEPRKLNECTNKQETDSKRKKRTRSKKCSNTNQKRGSALQKQRIVNTHKEYARKHGGIFLRMNERNDTRAEYRCSKGHKFTRDINEIRDQKWCPVCVIGPLLNDRSCKEAKALDEQYNIAYQKKQQHLIQKAKLEMLYANGSSFPNAHCTGSTDPEQQKEVSIQQSAERDAHHSGDGLMVEQASAVLRILKNAGNPYNVLQIRRAVLGRHKENEWIETVKKVYKALALKVHPDKNPHPRSTDAMNILNDSLNRILSASA